MSSHVPFVALALALTVAPPAIARQAVPVAVAGQVVDTPLTVPIDHARPELGRGVIHLESGAPFDPAKPTVLVVADGQQFYVQRGRVATIQNDSFGPELNVIGVIGRGTSKAILDWAAPEGRVNWPRAMQAFASRQWVEDIEAARRAVAGDAPVMIYGVSGGGLLAHQYLAAHGDKVSRAVVGTSPVAGLSAALGLRHDHFWDELGSQDPKLQPLLLEALKKGTLPRPILIQLLQRQNFFVPREKLGAERAALIQEMARGDEAALARRREEYQVDAVQRMLDSPAGIPIRVRLYELVRPVVPDESVLTRAVLPDLENQATIAGPLLEAERRGDIAAPVLDLAAPGAVTAPMLMLAGRWDHTVDYRTQISLAARYPAARLLLLDDDHMLEHFKQQGLMARVVTAFLAHGPGSPAMDALDARLRRSIWTEGP
ncbi:MAG: hypothetical protein ACREAA_20480 [Candidatus Polarisedimenticolia bacterium]